MHREDARNQILHAAGAVFAEKGFERATVREICRAADVNLASVNYYFGDKERLYIEAVKHAQRLREQQSPLPDWDESTPPAEKLRMFIRTMLERMLGQQQAPWQPRLIMREIMEPTRACEEMVRELFRPYFLLLLGILGELLPRGVPEHRLHQLAFTIIGQCVYYRVGARVVSLLISEEERQQHFQLEELAKHIAAVSLAAIEVESSLYQSSPCTTVEPAAP